MKILVVEDDKDLMEIITKSLEKERYVVSQAPDYRTAVMKAGDYDYDCILLDLLNHDNSTYRGFILRLNIHTFRSRSVRNIPI